MLSYVLPVEEKVGLRGGEEERSPGSETRPLLGSTEGSSLMVLQHALTHAPAHDGTDKPPASPPDVSHSPQALHTATPPPQDASATTTATSSAATSPGQPHHHPPAPGTTHITTGTSIITTTAAKPSLKRVSFGSSKGSMVETLIYDSPVGEEERIPEEEDTPHTPLATHFKDPVSQRFGTETGAQQKPASKVRVTFYESSKPLIVTSPEPSDLDQYSPHDLLMASPTAQEHAPAFDRQISTESGRDNPFRPDGDISREADQIVEAIKSGRPLLATPASPDAPDAPSPQGTPATEPLLSPTQASPQHQSPPPTNQGAAKAGQGRGASLGSPGKAGANGSAPGDNASTPGPVEVKHATVTPTEAADVERVVIKKKNKCGCCVIQ